MAGSAFARFRVSQVRFGLMVLADKYLFVRIYAFVFWISNNSFAVNIWLRPCLNTSLIRKIDAYSQMANKCSTLSSRPFYYVASVSFKMTKKFCLFPVHFSSSCLAWLGARTWGNVLSTLPQRQYDCITTWRGHKGTNCELPGLSDESCLCLYCIISSSHFNKRDINVLGRTN